MLSAAVACSAVLLLVVTLRYGMALDHKFELQTVNRFELDSGLGENEEASLVTALSPDISADLSETRRRRSPRQHRHRAAINRHRRRQSCSNTQEQRLPCAAQFFVDESKYSNVTDETEERITKWWREDYKMNSCDYWFRFNSNDGCLTIRKDGLYFLYAQMTYNNTKPVSGFSVVSQWARGPSQQHLAKCLTKAYNMNQVMTSTCHTATVAQLHHNQLVCVYNKAKFHRPIITSPQSSFWGVYKIN